ncbi:hypothetical protein FOA43_001685 [Brettanomyces nanus]|uniref:Quinate transporter n=1 Tax=Eeniella nana TaxID=13502 RepID=A0A875S060_EENNA|nr:uncharacterized protein FOA43_001685 [Brettanomyces nanus]QPG74358.1 hypothetical protein FOA43_001685 [Brettanomyces nanus]
MWSFHFSKKKFIDFFDVLRIEDNSSHPAPKEVYGYRIYLLALSAAAGSSMFGYDSGFIGGTLTLPAFTAKFGLDSATGDALSKLKSDIVSTFQGGAFFGASFSYFFNEKFGRKRTLLIFSALFMIGVILQVASSGNVGLIYAGRAITGVAVGTTSMVVPIYIAEWAPPAARGRLVGLYECVYQCSSVIAFWVDYGVKINISDTSDSQWLIPFGLQFIFGGACFSLMLLQPESYRWLLKADRVDEAQRNLSVIRMLPKDHEYILWEIATVQQQLQEESQLVKIPGYDEDATEDWKETIKHPTRWGIVAKFRELKKPGIRNRLLLGFSVMIFQNLAGINALNYYSPTIFKDIGVTGNSVDLLATGVFGIVKAVTNILFVIGGVDRYGRRGPLLLGSSVTCLCMLYLGVYTCVAGSFDHTVPMDSGSRCAIAMVYIFAIFFAFSWNSIPFIFCSEVFPTRVRNLCMAMCVMMQWLMQFVIVYSNPYMMTNIKYGTFFFFAACLFVSVPFVYFLLPETRGLTLENMDIMFNEPGFAISKRYRTKAIIEKQKEEERQNGGFASLLDISKDKIEHEEEMEGSHFESDIEAESVGM